MSARIFTMSGVMLQPNSSILSRKGSGISSLSWTKCLCGGKELMRGRSRVASREIWPRLVVSVAAEDGEATDSSRKGFGTPKKVAKPGVKKRGTSRGAQQGVLLLNNANRSSDQEGSSQLSKVIEVVDKKVSGGRVSRLRVDPKEAKKGKVDFVRVQTWGEDEESGKLENLKVKSFSPAVTSSPQESGPFYDKLVNRLQLLESKGEIAVAQVKPLPSFDRWVFGEERYVQFLVDQRAVFQALRDVIATIKKEKCGPVADLEVGFKIINGMDGAAKAVSLFAEDLGLDRCKVLDADITSFVESLEPRGLSVVSFTPTTQADSYAKYLRQLGSSSLENSEKAKGACLKFLAHVFSIYVSHLTTVFENMSRTLTRPPLIMRAEPLARLERVNLSRCKCPRSYTMAGMRVGAKAMDNLAVLGRANALSFYRDYPLEGKDPLKVFIQTMNAAGPCILSEEDHEEVMEELPKAMQKTSLLLSVLAVEEQVV